MIRALLCMVLGLASMPLALVDPASAAVCAGIAIVLALWPRRRKERA